MKKTKKYFLLRKLGLCQNSKFRPHELSFYKRFQRWPLNCHELKNRPSIAHKWKTIKVGTDEPGLQCGNRLPLISIDKGAKLGFHITTCISGDGNVGYNTKDDPTFSESNGLTKGRWYLLEISQRFASKKSPQGCVLDILGFDLVTAMLVTSLCWWLYDGDLFQMLVAESLYWRLFSLCWWFSQYIKSIMNGSSTSQTCHLHIWSPTFVTNIDLTL